MQYAENHHSNTQIDFFMSYEQKKVFILTYYFQRYLVFDTKLTVIDIKEFHFIFIECKHATRRNRNKELNILELNVFMCNEIYTAIDRPCSSS